MNDDSMIKIMQALDLDYSKAILSTMHFGKSIESLNKQLAGMKSIALQSAKDINTVFSSQLGQVAGNKTIVDQYGNSLVTIGSMTDSAREKTEKLTSAQKAQSQAIQDIIKQYKAGIVDAREFVEVASGYKVNQNQWGTLPNQLQKDQVALYPQLIKAENEHRRILDEKSKILKSLNKERKDTTQEIKASALEQMKAQAASIQQRATTKGLSQDYAQQAGTLREQLSVIQARLHAEGKLTAEEVKQTQQLKEQLDILRAQTKTAVADDIRENPSTFGQEWERRSSWFITGAMFYGTINAAKEAKEAIKDVEMGMVELARVMDDSTFVFEDYRDELFQLGIDYGQTFENVQQIALRWAQSGYNVADSLELTKTSLLALNTAELDAKNATESMIGIMAQWQLKAEDMALVMDKINITADNYSVTSQDLVDGLLRSSSAARNMNMSLDETIGLLTVMREASGRTGAEVGNALNSILSYITRGKSIDTLESLGIEMFTDSAKTQFRNAMDIFKDIHANWNSLSKDIQDGFVKSADEAGLFSEEMANALGIQEEWNDVQQRDASQAAAGVYRRNYFIGMIERMANVQDVLNNMIDAEGYSMAENAKTMETLEKKQESLKASAEQLAVAIGDAGLEGALKGLVDGGTNAINTINNLPKPMRDLVLATTSTFIAVKTLELGMKTFGLQIPGVSQMITSLTNGTWSLTAALKAGGAGIATFAKANAPLLALSASIGVIVAITNHIKKQREEMEKSIEVFQRQKEISNSISDLLPQYEKLSGASSLTAEEQQKLLDVKQKITDLLPETKTALDNENLSLSTQLEIIKDLNNEELERARQLARKNIEKYENKYDNSVEEVQKASKALEELTARYDELYKKRNELSRDEQYEFDLLPSRIESQSQRLEYHKNIIDTVDESTKLYNETLENQNTILDENTNNTNKNTDAKENQAEAMEKLIEKFNDSTSKLQAYYSILGEVNSKEGLSSKSKQEIINKHQELLPYLSDEQELRKKLMEVIADEERVQQKAYSAMLMQSEDFYNVRVKGNAELVKSLNDYYDTDFNNFKSLAEAKAKVEMQLISKLSGLWQKYYQGAKINPEAEANLRKMVGMQVGDWQNAKATLNALDSFRDLENHFSNLTLDLGGVDFASDLRDKKSGSKDNRQFLEAIDAEIRAIKIRNDELERTGKLLQEQIALAKDTDSLEGLNKQYELTGKLITHNAQLLMSFKNEQDSIHEMANKIRETYSKLNIDSWFDANAEMTSTYVNEFNKASKKQQEEMQKIFDQVQKLKKAWMESASEIEKVNSNVRQLSLSQDKLLEQMDKYLEKHREMAVKKWIEEQNRLYTEQQDRLKSLESIQETIVQIIRKRGEEERKALDESLKAEMDSLEERHNERKKKYQEDLDLFRKITQAKIEELDRQNSTEDYQENLRKEKEKADELQKQIDVLSLDDSLTARNQVVELRKQLAEQNEKIAKIQRDRERNLIKESLQDQLKEYEESIREKENIADRAYENDKRRLEEEYRINQEYLERKYSDEKVYAEARRAIMRGQVEVSRGVFMDIYDAYKDFEDKFGKGMGVLGDIIKKDFLYQLEQARKAIDELEYMSDNLRNKYDSDYNPSDKEMGYKSPSSGSTSGKLSSMSKTDYERYVYYKQLWENAKRDGNKAAMDSVSQSAQALRDKYGIRSDKYSYNDLKNLSYEQMKIAGYDTGGPIPRDGIIYAHEKELYLNQQQQNHLWNFIKELPQIKMPELKYNIPQLASPTPLKPNITLKFDNLVRIEGNVTQEAIPEVKEAVLDANQDLVNKLNKGGIFRPAW